MKRMGKKLICAAASVAMTVTPVALYATEPEAEMPAVELQMDMELPEEAEIVTLAGEEPAEPVIEIATVADLQAFAASVNAGVDYKGTAVTLADDLDLSGVTWTPVGTKDLPFNGIFDGQEYTISNVAIQGSGDYTGFFGYTNGATIQNFTLNGVTMTGHKNKYGALVGHMGGTTIQNCEVMNAEIGRGSSISNNCAILAGSSYTGTITDCRVSDSSVVGYEYVGGIGGSGYAKINNCTVERCTVTATSWKGGGIIGQLNEGNFAFDNLHVTDSRIVGNSNIGGLVGFANYGQKKTFTNCTVGNTVVGDPAANSVTQVGGLFGSMSPHEGDVITVSGCDVIGASLVSNGALSEASAVLGAVYWRSENVTNVDLSLQDSVISDFKVEADELQKVGVLFGTTQKDSNYDVANVTVANSPEKVEVVGAVNTDTKVNIESGTYDKDIGKYTGDGKTSEKDENGNYVVVDVEANMLFAQDAADKNLYNIVIKGVGDTKITDFKTVEFSLSNNVTEGAVEYTVEAAPGLSLAERDGKYMLYLNKETADAGALVDDGNGIIVGAVRFTGYGAGAMVTEDVIAELEIEDSIAKTTSLKKAYIDYAFEEVEGDLKVTIQFNNPITARNKPEYNQMRVVITGADGYEEIHEIGDPSWISTYKAEEAVIETSLPVNNRYTVTVSGDGYRTAKKSVVLHEEGEELLFWNNVKDEAVDGETKNFLGGEIVADGVINVYDLSAVVSYFGEEGITVQNHPEYIRYDLNRDGKVDSKDVAMVLVSWNE